jgi:hypothetical protein
MRANSRAATVLYWLLNGVFHLVHISIIVFAMTGWMFPAFRLAHLVLILLTLGSWFILGRWFGRGYCPVSDWHWKMKAALGGGRPSGTYIHQLLQGLTGRRLDSSAVDRMVVIATLVLAAISVALNMPALYGRLAAG